MKSKKHLINEEHEKFLQIIKNQKKSKNQIRKKAICESDDLPTCKFCHRTFSAKTHMYRHQKYNCKQISSIDEKLKDEKSEIKELKEQIKILMDQNKMILNIADKNADVAIQNSKNVERSTRCMTKAMKYFNSAPRMKQLEGKDDVKLLTYDNTQSTTSAVKKIIVRYNNGGLVNFLGNFIIKEYKKDDPKKQSVWNTDTNRLHFIIRELISKSKNEWISDKSGIKLTKLIIDPLLKEVVNMLNEYIKTGSKIDNNENTTSSIFQGVVDNIESCEKIKAEIGKRTLHKKILKYISNLFELTSLVINSSKNNNDLVESEVDDSSHDSLSKSSDSSIKKPQKLKKTGKIVKSIKVVIRSESSDSD
jgi:hypothetical protein